jgi:inosine-uridine nucleoside N-ribohydrolase
VRLAIVLDGRAARRPLLRPACAADQGPRRVVISTDFTPGLVGPLPASPYPSDVDDGIAVAYALNSPQLRVDALAVQFGNNEAGPSTRQARTMVHEVMGRRDVPIAQGATGRLRDDADCVNDGVRLLARELREGPATVLAMGPLTDLACLARTDPVAAGNVVEVLAQIGARPGEPYDLNGRPALFSLNVGADPAATEAVLASPALARATITASPYHLAGEQLLDDARVDRLGGDRPEGRWLRDQARAFRLFWTASFGDLGLRPWDQTLVHALVRPSAYRVRDVGWRMVSCADPTGRNANPDCAGHGPTQFPTRDGEPAQLWLGDGEGQRARPRLRILDAYVSPREAIRFLDAVAALEP